MEFKAGEEQNFLSIFESSCEKIRAFPGCEHLQLWRDERNVSVFFTFSLWRDVEALEEYRHSELFQSTWKKTKALFAAKAQAWSLDTIHQLD